MTKKNKKIGHQAPKEYVVNKFNSIEIDGDFAYCKSHNFIYNKEHENWKLYQGLPCYYTDIRFVDTALNFYKNCYVYSTRFKDISLKACIRKTLNCKNIPVGTIVSFNKSWYYPKKNIDNSYKFRIKKENKLNTIFEVNDPAYFQDFANCEFSNELISALRKNRFLVKVEKNESFLGNMFNAAVAFTGSNDFKDTEIEGDVAVAYGYGKIIGFSSFKNDFMGYSCGCDNILWDRHGEFNKWSQCNEIPKTSSIEEIIKILKSQ